MKRALQQGHVDDEDFKGDVEMNRPGAKGYRTPQKKKAAKAAEKVRPDQPVSPIIVRALIGIRLPLQLPPEKRIAMQVQANPSPRSAK